MYCPVLMPPSTGLVGAALGLFGVASVLGGVGLVLFPPSVYSITSTASWLLFWPRVRSGAFSRSFPAVLSGVSGGGCWRGVACGCGGCGGGAALLALPLGTSSNGSSSSRSTMSSSAHFEVAGLGAAPPWGLADCCDVEGLACCMGLTWLPCIMGLNGLACCGVPNGLGWAAMWTDSGVACSPGGRD